MPLPPIDPATLSPLDTRPIFSRGQQPGGPWHRYRPTTWVDAIRIQTPWLRQRDDGMLIEEDPAWIILDPVTGDFSRMGPSEFAATYELID